MIFYGNGVVWNPKNNSRLCRFVNGLCEVTDKNEIAFLVRAGYKHEPIDYGDEAPEQKPVEALVEEQTKVAAPTKKRVRKTNASE